MDLPAFISLSIGTGIVVGMIADMLASIFGFFWELGKVV
jgi:hypothetical protein